MSTRHPPRSEKPREVLLVEDNPGDARLMREAFETVEAETTLHTVDTADDALDFLRRRVDDDSLPLPDLVLLDLKLPGKDGSEVLESVRNDPQLRLLPVIVLTSSEDSEDIERCYDAQANAYLTKPVDADEFDSLVNTVERFWFGQVRLPPVSA